MTGLREFLSSLARRLSGEVCPEEAAYRRLVHKLFQPGAIIDVGAYEGNWTRLVRRVFPHAPVMMVEPQREKQRILEQVCNELGDARLEPVLLGRQSGTRVTFFEMETGSSIFPERSNVSRRPIEHTLVSLDSLTSELRSPIFLKIDAQGAELEILEGARDTLDRCEVVQLEVAVLPYNEGAPTMLDVLTYMSERQFFPLDLGSLSRPNGVDLVHIDIIFAAASSELRPKQFVF